MGGYRSERLTGYDVTLHINENYASTNMVSTLFCAGSEFNGASDIVISYCDIVYQKSVRDVDF